MFSNRGINIYWYTKGIRIRCVRQYTYSKELIRQLYDMAEWLTNNGLHDRYF